MEKPIIGCIFKQKGKSKQKNNKCLLLNNLAECITKGDLYVKLNYGNSIFATVQLSTADNRLKEQHRVAKIVLCEPSCAVSSSMIAEVKFSL